MTNLTHKKKTQKSDKWELPGGDKFPRLNLLCLKPKFTVSLLNTDNNNNVSKLNEKESPNIFGAQDIVFGCYINWDDNNVILYEFKLNKGENIVCNPIETMALVPTYVKFIVFCVCE